MQRAIESRERALRKALWQWWTIHIDFRDNGGHSGLLMTILTTCLWIALGSGLGGVCRHLLNLAVTSKAGNTFPWGTLIANASGSLLIGVLAALSLSSERLTVGQGAHAFAVIGFCGGYTTFSSFSLQSLQLLKTGQYTAALGNVIGSVAISIAFTAFGFLLGKSLT